jgi:hypothetical protein
MAIEAGGRKLASSARPIESLSDAVAIMAIESLSDAVASHQATHFPHILDSGSVQAVTFSGVMDWTHDQALDPTASYRPWPASRPRLAASTKPESGDKLSAFLRTNRAVYPSIIASGLRRELVVEHPSPPS